ncbi:MAG: hypothetical protein D6705_06635 [Deltaproteobacteria bacterium]|nr:MAG: hypothetical protein D6705_06635 [Deltaproteobacteria bacterium]
MIHRNDNQLRRAGVHLAAFALSTLLLGVGTAHAGEIVVGKEPLPTDDKGKITAEGRKMAVSELHSAPGEEIWTIHIWASLDRGAPGPLYIEFWDKWEGKDVKVPWAYEDPNYDGGKYYSASFELEGNVGFNVGHTYRLRAVQVNEKGKDVILAKGGKVKLIKTPAPEGQDEEETSEDEEENLPPELRGDDEPESETGEADQAPPEMEASKKKGCRTGAPSPADGLLAAGLLLAAWLRRRRR